MFSVEEAALSKMQSDIAVQSVGRSAQCILVLYTIHGCSDNLLSVREIAVDIDMQFRRFGCKLIE